MRRFRTSWASVAACVAMVLPAACSSDDGAVQGSVRGTGQTSVTTAPATVPTTSETSPPVEPYRKIAEWRSSVDGYSSLATMSIGPVRRLDDPELGAAADAGSCSPNGAQFDAILPFELTYTNTTEGFDIVPTPVFIRTDGRLFHLWNGSACYRSLSLIHI